MQTVLAHFFQRKREAQHMTQSHAYALLTKSSSCSHLFTRNPWIEALSEKHVGVEMSTLLNLIANQLRISADNADGLYTLSGAQAMSVAKHIAASAFIDDAPLHGAALYDGLIADEITWSLVAVHSAFAALDKNIIRLGVSRLREQLEADLACVQRSNGIALPVSHPAGFLSGAEKNLAPSSDSIGGEVLVQYV